MILTTDFESLKPRNLLVPSEVVKCIDKNNNFNRRNIAQHSSIPKLLEILKCAVNKKNFECQALRFFDIQNGDQKLFKKHLLDEMESFLFCLCIFGTLNVAVLSDSFSSSIDEGES